MKHALIFGLMFLLVAGMVYAAAGDCTKFLNASLGTTACVGGNAGIGNFTGDIYGNILTIGANETIAGRLVVGSDGNYTLVPSTFKILATAATDAKVVAVAGNEGAVLSHSAGGNKLYSWSFRNSTYLPLFLDGSQINIFTDIPIPSGGRIGVATRSPQYMLDVNGTFGVSGLSTFSVGLKIPDNQRLIFGTVEIGNIKANVAGTNIDYVTEDLAYGHDFQIWTGSTYKHALFIEQASGEIGVGTMSPQYVLDINGTTNIRQDAASQGFIIDQNGNGIAAYIDNAGTKHGLYIDQNAVSDAYQYGLEVFSDNAQVNSGSLVFFNQAHASTTANVLQIQNDGTGYGVYIDQNGNDKGLYIDSEATGSYGLHVDCSNNNTAWCAHIENSGPYSGLTNGLDVVRDGGSEIARLLSNRGDSWGTNAFFRNLDSTRTAGPLMYLYNQNASDDQPALSIQQESATARAISATGVTSDVAFYVRNTHATGGVGYFYHPSGSGIVVNLNDAGTGNSMLIDKNNNGTSLFIDSEGVDSNPGLWVDVVSGTGGGTAGRFIESGVNSNSATSVVYVQNTAGSNNRVLALLDAGEGSGLYIDTTGNGAAIDVNHARGDYGLSLVSLAGVQRETSKPFLRIYNQQNDTGSFWEATALIQGGAVSTQNSPVLALYSYYNATKTQKTLYVDNEGIGDGVFLDQNGNGIALNIDSEATSATSIQVYADAQTSGSVISARAEAGTFSGNILALRAGSTSNTGIGLLVQQFSTVGGRAVQIEEQGTGKALFIDDNGNGTAFEIDSENTGINGDHAMKVDSAMTVGNAIYFYSNAARTSGNSLVLIQDDNAAAAGDSLKITNDGGVGGAGNALDILQSGNSSAIYVVANEDYAGGGAMAFHAWVNNARLSQGFRIISDDEKEQTDILGSRGTDTNLFYRNLDSANSGGAVVYINQVNASDDQPALKLANAGAGSGIATTNTGTGKSLSIVHTGPGMAAYISSTAGTQASYGLQVEMLNASTNAVTLATKVSATSSNWLSAPSTTVEGSNWFWRNDAAAATAGPLVFIEQDNAGDDQDALQIQQDGSGKGIGIFHYNATAPAAYGLYVQTASAIAGEFQQRKGGADTDFFRIGEFNSTYDSRFYRNLASGSTAGPILTIYNDAATDDQRALFLVQDAPNNALYIDQNGDTSGLDGTVNGAGMIGGDNTGNPGRGLYIYTNEGATSSQELVKFRSDNAAYDQPILAIDNDGTGKDIDLGSGQGITSNSTCTIINGATSTWNIC